MFPLLFFCCRFFIHTHRRIGDPSQHNGENERKEMPSADDDVPDRFLLLRRNRRRICHKFNGTGCRQFSHAGWHSGAGYIVSVCQGIFHLYTSIKDTWYLMRCLRHWELISCDLEIFEYSNAISMPFFIISYRWTIRLCFVLRRCHQRSGPKTRLVGHVPRCLAPWSTQYF